MPRPMPKNAPEPLVKRLHQMGFADVKDFSERSAISYGTARSVLLLSTGRSVTTLLKLAAALHDAEGNQLVTAEQLDDILDEKDVTIRRKKLEDLLWSARLHSFNEWGYRADVSGPAVQQIIKGEIKRDAIKSARAVAGALGLTLRELATYRGIYGG